MREASSLFGVELGTETIQELHGRIHAAMGGVGNPLFIVTLNPEILLKAEADSDYRTILNKATLKIIDGFGIVVVSKLKRLKAGARMAGVDLAKYIVQEGNSMGLCIGFIIRKDGLSREGQLESVLRQWGIKQFEILPIDLDSLDNLEINDSIDILLVGLGAPYQEQCIDKILITNPQLKIVIGVGGTFDFWTGSQLRAPYLLQKIGLEWLWRLGCQSSQAEWPIRLKRIWNAVPVFLYKAIFIHKNN